MLSRDEIGFDSFFASSAESSCSKALVAEMTAIAAQLCKSVLMISDSHEREIVVLVR